MTASTDLHALLPHVLPECYNERLLLFAARRMAAHGLNDAHAAHAMLGWFGLGFRRPLVLLRALMAELSRTSTRRLVVAPCCCPRMTAAEKTLLEAIRGANRAPYDAHAALAALGGVPACIGTLGSAQAVAQAFADLGRPLGP